MSNAIARVLKSSDYLMMPWKNGKGITYQIAIFPPESTVSESNFLWRLSTARMTESGPFSAFPGYQRLLTLTRGESLRLKNRVSQKVSFLKNGEVFEFSGEEEIESESVTETLTDLNFVFRRGQIKAQLQVLSLGGKPRSFYLEGKSALIYSISGEVSVSAYPGEIRNTLAPQDTLWVESSGETPFVLVEPQSPKIQLAFIEIE